MWKLDSTRRTGLVVATLVTLPIVLYVAVLIVPANSLEGVSRDIRDAFDDAIELVTDNIEGIFDTAEEIREDLQEAAERNE